MFRLFHRIKNTIMALSDSPNQLVFAENFLIQTLTQSTPKKRTKNVDFTEMPVGYKVLSHLEAYKLK